MSKHSLSLLLAAALLGGAPGVLHGQSVCAGYGLPLRVGTISAIPEVSGLVRSLYDPRIFWVISDSGDDAVIYAIALTGQLLGTFRVRGAENWDWEALTSSWGEDGKPYLVVGEIGDNQGEDELPLNEYVILYRFEEPVVDFEEALRTPIVNGETGPVLAARARYPDGPRDAESLWIDPWDGATYIISKRDPEPRLYRYPGSLRQGEIVSLVYGGAFRGGPSWPTDAAVSADGLSLVLFNGGEIAEYHRSAGEGAEAFLRSEPLRLLPGEHHQGEAIAFDDDVVVSTGECADDPQRRPCQTPAPINRTACVGVPLRVSVAGAGPGAKDYWVFGLSAQASSPIGVDHVEFRVDGVHLGYTTESPYEALWDASGSAGGEHEVLMIASDRAGNRASASARVWVDREPPTVQIVPPIPPLPVLALADDGPMGSGVVSVSFFADGFPIGDEDTTPPYSLPWETVIAELAEGLHSLRAVARDRAGNEGSSAPIPIIVNPVPTITALSVSPEPPQPFGTTITWTATATGGTPPLQYRFWRYNSETSDQILVQDYSTTNTYTWTPDSGDVGSHRIIVWVRNAGSTSEYDAVFVGPAFSITP